MPKQSELKGLRFTRLYVLERIIWSGKQGRWKCLCDCGNIIYVPTRSLTSGNTKSCGCIGNEKTAIRSFRHGHCSRNNRTRIHRIWGRMRQRCNDPNSSDKDKYYNRGIKVCDEWNNSFISFLFWAITNGYRDNLTIERIDNNKNYSPENCTWIAPEKQARNKRNNHFITHKGQTKTLAEWGEITGLETSLIRYRLKNNWPEDKLFKKPYKKDSNENRYVKKYCA